MKSIIFAHRTTCGFQHRASASDGARPGTLHYVQATAPEALAAGRRAARQLCLVLDKRDAAFAAMEAGGGLRVPTPTNALRCPISTMPYGGNSAEAAKLVAQLCLNPAERSRLPPRPQAAYAGRRVDLECRLTNKRVPSRWPGHHPSGCSRAVPTCPHHLRRGGDGGKPSFYGLSPVSPLSPPNTQSQRGPACEGYTSRPGTLRVRALRWRSVCQRGADRARTAHMFGGINGGISWRMPSKRLRRRVFWRMGWDSNPRYAFDVYALSRRAPSTARPPIPHRPTLARGAADF
jgi:hypothetical protein